MFAMARANGKQIGIRKTIKGQLPRSSAPRIQSPRVPRTSSSDLLPQTKGQLQNLRTHLGYQAP